MAIGAFIPLAVFIVILTIVGARLLRLWLRTGELPEMSLGFALLIIGASMPLAAAGRAPELAMQMTGRACFALGMIAVWIGISLKVFFTYWVFQRDSAWGWLLFATTSVALACGVVYMSIENFSGDSVEAIKTAMRPGTLTVVGTVFVTFLWAGWESFRYWTSLRRQLALGLTDAVLVNRFLLWSVASATTCALIIVIAGCILAGMTIVREPVPLVAIAAAGCVMSATWYLAFFAPSLYQRWVRRRVVQNS